MCHSSKKGWWHNRPVLSIDICLLLFLLLCWLHKPDPSSMSWIHLLLTSSSATHNWLSFNNYIIFGQCVSFSSECYAHSMSFFSVYLSRVLAHCQSSLESICLTFLIQRISQDFAISHHLNSQMPEFFPEFLFQLSHSYVNNKYKHKKLLRCNICQKVEIKAGKLK